MNQPWSWHSYTAQEQLDEHKTYRRRWAAAARDIRKLGGELQKEASGCSWSGSRVRDMHVLVQELNVALKNQKREEVDGRDYETDLMRLEIAWAGLSRISSVLQSSAQELQAMPAGNRVMDWSWMGGRLLEIEKHLRVLEDLLTGDRALQNYASLSNIIETEQTWYVGSIEEQKMRATARGKTAKDLWYENWMKEAQKAEGSEQLLEAGLEFKNSKMWDWWTNMHRTSMKEAGQVVIQLVEKPVLDQLLGPHRVLPAVALAGMWEVTNDLYIWKTDVIAGARVSSRMSWYRDEIGEHDGEAELSDIIAASKLGWPSRSYREAWETWTLANAT